MTFVSTHPTQPGPNPASTRGRLARDVAMMISSDYGNWREAIGEHTADSSAAQVIARLRSMVGPGRLRPSTAIAIQGE